VQQSKRAAGDVFVECNGQQVRIRRGLFYTTDHMWAEATPERQVRTGVTDYAQRFLREPVSLVTVERSQTTEPDIRKGEKFGTIFGRYNRVTGSREYGCTAFDLVTLVTGRIADVNDKVMDRPELINRDPYGDGWIALVDVFDVQSCCRGLITHDGYKRTVADRRQSRFREI